MAEKTTPEPKHIRDSLADAVHAQPDEVRAAATREADLTSEISGLTEDIAGLEDQMHMADDKDLPQKLDEATNASLDAQRELRNVTDE